MEPIFFSNALVLTEFLGSGGICKKILHFDVSRGLRSQKTPILSHFTREFGQKLRAIALGGPTTPKSKISSQIIYKCTKPLIPSVKFRGHRTFFPCNKSRLKWRNWDQLLTEYIGKLPWYQLWEAWMFGTFVLITGDHTFIPAVES